MALSKSGTFWSYQSHYAFSCLSIMYSWADKKSLLLVLYPVNHPHEGYLACLVNTHNRRGMNMPHDSRTPRHLSETCWSGSPHGMKQLWAADSLTAVDSCPLVILESRTLGSWLRVLLTGGVGICPLAPVQMFYYKAHAIHPHLVLRLHPIVSLIPSQQLQTFYSSECESVGIQSCHYLR